MNFTYLEPQNEEIYIQKAKYFLKARQSRKSYGCTKKVHAEFAEDFTDLYSLIGMEYLFLEQFENAKDYFMRCLEKILKIIPHYIT